MPASSFFNPNTALGDNINGQNWSRNQMRMGSPGVPLEGYAPKPPTPGYMQPLLPDGATTPNEYNVIYGTGAQPIQGVMSTAQHRSQGGRTMGTNRRTAKYANQSPGAQQGANQQPTRGSDYPVDNIGNGQGVGMIGGGRQGPVRAAVTGGYGAQPARAGRIGYRGTLQSRPDAGGSGLQHFYNMNAKRSLDNAAKDKIDPTTGLAYAPTQRAMGDQINRVAMGPGGLEGAQLLSNKFAAMNGHDPQAVADATAAIKAKQDSMHPKTPATPPASDYNGLINSINSLSLPGGSAPPASAPEADDGLLDMMYPKTPQAAPNELDEFGVNKADGGDTSTVHPYIVNEEGPEAWQPDGGNPQLMPGGEKMVTFPKDGKVIPHRQTMRMMAQGKVEMPKHREGGGGVKASASAKEKEAWRMLHAKEVEDSLKKDAIKQGAVKQAQKTATGNLDVAQNPIMGRLRKAGSRIGEFAKRIEPVVNPVAAWGMALDPLLSADPRREQEAQIAYDAAMAPEGDAPTIPPANPVNAFDMSDWMASNQKPLIGDQASLQPIPPTSEPSAALDEYLGAVAPQIAPNALPSSGPPTADIQRARTNMMSIPGMHEARPAATNSAAFSTPYGTASVEHRAAPNPNRTIEGIPAEQWLAQTHARQGMEDTAYVPPAPKQTPKEWVVADKARWDAEGKANADFDEKNNVPQRRLGGGVKRTASYASR